MLDLLNPELRVLLALGALLCFLVCMTFPARPARWLARVKRAFRTRCHGPACVMVGAVALALPALIALDRGIPLPEHQDDYGYILAGDTYSRGRLTNPSHSMWEHFESLQILVYPTYQAKYPPGQGLVLAAGKLLTGQPIVGAWASSALACAATCWMLRAWLPVSWATLGGLLAAMHPLVLAWSRSYMGGSLTMAGGAIALGAYGRFTRNPRRRHAAALGAGIAILANCRPYEGMAFSLVLSGHALVWLIRQDRRWVLLRRLALPICGVLAPVSAWMAYYNYRVTGDAFKMPYVLYQEQYSSIPSFSFIAAGPELQYRHKSIRDTWQGWVPDQYLRQQTLGGRLKEWWERTLTLTKAYVWPFVLGIPFLAGLVWMIRDRRLWFAGTASALFVGFMLPVTYHTSPHYLAPGFGLFLLFIVQSLRRLSTVRRRGARVGAAVTFCVIAICVGWVGVFWARYAHYTHGNRDRARIEEQLKATGGRHLVVVRYAHNHNSNQEWVYNEADIDGARVVWAREMDSARNRRLVEYFSGSSVWLLKPDEAPVELVPYAADSPR